MSWLFALAAVAGLLLGSMFRVPALVAASAVGAVAFAVAGAASGRSALAVAGIVAAGLATLQIAYLLGLAATHALGSRGGWRNRAGGGGRASAEATTHEPLKTSCRGQAARGPFST